MLDTKMDETDESLNDTATLELFGCFWESLIDTDLMTQQ